MPSVIAYPDRFYCRDVKQHILIAIVCSKWLNFKITEAGSLRLPKLGASISSISRLTSSKGNDAIMSATIARAKSWANFVISSGVNISSG
jgi:hypothetical protein